MCNPIVVEAYRNGILESFHRGAVAIVNRKSELIYSLGDPHQICYPRSALKYFQHISLIESGAFEHFNFSLKELAIMCGSHNGEQEHVETVLGILNKIGLGVQDLHCGPQMPTLKKDIQRLILNGEKAQSIHNNCSGKHAGFLALCVFLNLDHHDYWKPNHPIQKMILKVVEEMHEIKSENMVTAMDGCSAPIYSMSVYNQAVGYKNLVNAEAFGIERQKACNLVIDAVTQFPLMVAGTNRYCSEMMKICGTEIIGKTGAEGIFSMALRKSGLGICIKIDDGKMLPQYFVAQKFIQESNLFNDSQLSSLNHYIIDPILNWNKYETGVLQVNPLLFSSFEIPVE